MSHLIQYFFLSEENRTLSTYVVNLIFIRICIWLRNPLCTWFTHSNRKLWMVVLGRCLQSFFHCIKGVLWLVNVVCMTSLLLSHLISFSCLCHLCIEPWLSGRWTRWHHLRPLYLLAWHVWHWSILVDCVILRSVNVFFLAEWEVYTRRSAKSTSI